MLIKSKLLLHPSPLEGGSFSEDSPAGGGETLAEEAQSVESGDLAADVFEGNVFEVPSSKKPGETEPTEKQKLDKLAEEQQEREVIQQEVEERDKKKKEQQPKKDEVLEEEQTEEEQVEKKEDKSASASKDKRDYSGLPEKDIEFLKKQPNNIYNVVAPILKEKAAVAAKAVAYEQELKKFREDPNRLPENWYENERAIELTPEWQQLNNLYERVTFETEHAQQQINRLDAGLPYTVLTGFDPKTGYQVSQEIPNPGEDKAKLVELKAKFQKSVNNGVAQQMQYQQKATSLSENFKKQNQGINTYYDEAIETRFSKLPEQLKPKKEHEEMYISLVHPAHKTSSQTKLAAKMFSVLLNQGTVIKALRDQLNKNKKIDEDRRVAGPSNKSSLSSGQQRSNGIGPAKKLKIGENGRVAKDEVIDFGSLKGEFDGSEE